jgi:hypothetical protein
LAATRMASQFELNPAMHTTPRVESMNQ